MTIARKTSLTLGSLLLSAALGATGSLLLTHAAPAHADEPADDTVTVFVDATFGMRKNHLARQLTRSHAKYASRGYRVVTMSPYNENGDLVGFFVTYTRR